MQAKLAVNKRLATRNNKTPDLALLRCGFAICGHCGHNLLFQKKGAWSTTKESYVYACNKPDTPTRCNKVSIRTHLLDAVVWAYVEELIKDQSKVEARLAELEAQLTQNITVDLGPIDSKLAEIEQQLQNCATGIAKAQNEFIINQLLAKSEELGKTQKELLDLRDEVAGEVASKEKIRAKLDHFRNRWIHKLPALQKEPTLQDKRGAIEILGIRAIVWSTDHHPRYKIEMVPPEIESLKS